MSQNDYTIANQGFPAFRADLNSALQAIATNNSGTSAPSTMFANMWWYDSANNILYIRNEDNDAWIKFAELDQTNDKFILSGTLQLDDGTVSAPALTFNSDTNMGLYRGGTDILKFVTAGADRLTILANGDTGIGVSPSTTLHVKSASPIFRLETTGTVASGGTVYNTLRDSTGSDVFLNGFAGLANCYQFATIFANGFMRFLTGNQAEAMRIDSSGNVGIGVTGGAIKLDVLTTVSDNFVAKFENSHATGSYGISVKAGDDSGNYTADFANKSGTSLMRIRGDGNVGIGTSSPASLLSVSNGGAGGVEFSADASYSYVMSYNRSGSAWFPIFTNASSHQWGIAGTQKMTLNASGNLNIVGALSKGSGSFKIDHPLPAKTETHNLVHSFVESPQANNIYRGKVVLVDGSATVNIDTVSGMTDGTYVLLNTNTQCFTSNESGWTAIKGSVLGNTLTITSQESCTDTISWMVIGERHDQHMIDTEWTDENGKVIVEPLKEQE